MNTKKKRRMGGLDSLYLGALLMVGCLSPVMPVVVTAPPEQPAPPRTVVIISDLHFGLGRDAKGAWDAYEDFRWSSELTGFLDRVSADGNGATDLILNGDVFELWQSREGDCASSDPDRGCSEAEALDRMRRVIRAHQPDLQALGRFAASGDNRVVLVPGNHDAALLFPSVAAEVLTAIAAPTGRAEVAAAGFWMSKDRRIYAEHGHQIGLDPNRFRTWPRPFQKGRRSLYMERPWGESFVQSFYSRFEDRYPIIDNVASEADAIRFAIAREGAAGLLDATGRFLGFMLLKTSWAQAGEVLGNEGVPPEWDVAAVRTKGDGFLLESIPADDPLRALFAASTGMNTGSAVASMSDAEIIGICDGRWLSGALRKQTGAAAPVDCPRVPGGSLGAGTPDGVESENLGSLIQSRLRSRTKVFASYLGDLVGTLITAGVTTKPFELYVYSHTHGLDVGFELTVRGQKTRVVNSGAWQRVVTGKWLSEEQERRHLQKSEVLDKIPFDALPPCYGVVRILPPARPDDPLPAPIVSWYRSGPGSSGSYVASCE